MAKDLMKYLETAKTRQLSATPVLRRGRGLLDLLFRQGRVLWQKSRRAPDVVSLCQNQRTRRLSGERTAQESQTPGKIRYHHQARQGSPRPLFSSSGFPCGKTTATGKISGP